MNRLLFLIVLGAVTTFLVAPGASAQVGFAGEGRIGVTFPTGDLSDAEAGAGLSVGAELQANFQRNLTAYLGLHRHGFSCDDDCDLGDSPRSTGLNAGLKYIFPSPQDALVWGRGGIVANQLSTDDGSSSRNIGFEVGAGIDMPVAPNFYLVPNLGFVRHGAESNFSASFLTFGVGLHYHFN
jgi:opacity protein-like surface antigen